MATRVGGKLISYANGGSTVTTPSAPVLIGGVPSHEPPPRTTPQPAPVSGGPHLPPPVDAYTVTGTVTAPPHLASLGQAFTFAQSNFPAGNGAVTIARRVLLSA